MKSIWVGWLLAAGTCACSAPSKQQAATNIRIRWVRDPENLSPLTLPNQAAQDAATLLHCSLLKINFSTGRYAAALADSLPRVRLLGDSLLQLHYRLRPAATWDDGQPVLASDVAFTLKLLYCPGLPNEGSRAQYSFIRRIDLDTADPRRFTLTCRGQNTAYQSMSGDFPVLAEASLDPAHTLRRYSLATLISARPAVHLPDLQALTLRYEQANPARHPGRLTGCGPYRLTDWETDHLLTFTRKRHWWADTLRPRPPVLQAAAPQLQFVIIPDDATAVLALRRHEVDVLPDVAAREFRRLQASAAAQREFFFTSTTSYEVVTAGFNTRQPALRDSLTRQALSRLFDARQLLQATQLGQGQLTVGLVDPRNQYYYYRRLPLPAYSPPQAHGLLKRAGWQRQAEGWARTGPTGQPERLTLTLRYRAGDNMFETIALQFKAAAAVVGIPVALRPTTTAALSSAVRQGDFDIYVRTLKGSPFAFNYAPLLHSRAVGAGNYTGFSNRHCDQLMEELAQASAPAHRQQLLYRFQEMLQQQAPLLPLFFLNYRLAADQRLRQLHPSGLKPGYDATTMRWAANAPTP